MFFLLQDISNEENTYIAAGDPSDMAVMQSYNLAYNRGETTNRLGSGPSSYRGSSNNRVFNADPETQRFNTNSLTVTNPLHNPHLAEHHRNFNNSPLTTTSTAMNNSPNTALSDNRNTYYENSGDDEHTNDDNSAIRTSQLLYNRPGTSSTGGGPDVRPRTNSLFDRHSWYYAGEEQENEAVAAAIAQAKRKLEEKSQPQYGDYREEKFPYIDESSSATSFSHATYSVSSEASSLSLSDQIEPPPVPPKLWSTKMDHKGNVQSSTINNNLFDRDHYATIRSTAVWHEKPQKYLLVCNSL